jgi:prepilin-type N-terminal cleavage/methylation domain-containing protein
MRFLSAFRRSEQPEDAGFTVIEVMVAVTIFAVIATAFAFELTGALRVYKESRMRTVAEQLATEQLEDARRLPYDQTCGTCPGLGTVSGNPPGSIQPAQNKSVGGFDFVVTTRVSFVNDPLPGGFQSGANYKLVEVSVTPVGETESLADLETWVAPPTQPSLNRSVIQVKVADPIVNEYLEDVQIELRTGPSAPRNDRTDVAGAVTFADLLPNPTSGPTDHYELYATLAGYATHPDSLPPAPGARQQMSPGQLFPATLHMFKQVGFTVRVQDTLGALVPNAKVAVSSSHGTQVITLSTGTATITQVEGKPVVPNTQYTVTAFDTSGRYSTAQSNTVVPEADYRNDVLTTQFSPLVLSATPAVTTGVQVRVRTASGGAAVANAMVIARGGPFNVTIAGRTDTLGNVTINLPGGLGPFTIEVPAQLGNSAATTTANVPPTTTVTVNVAKAPPV